MISLRRHNEAKERLEQRMLKIKSFESVLSEAESFIKKDVHARKTPPKPIREDAILE